MKTFNSNEQLAAYVKNLTATEKKTFAAEYSLPNFKGETIVQWFIDNGAIVAPIEEETVVESDNVTQQDVVVVAENAPTATEENNVESAVVEEKSEAKKEEESKPLTEEHLRKVAAHYNGRVAALNKMLNNLTDTMVKVAFLDGQNLDKTLTMLVPTEKSAFSIDVSSFSPNHFANEANISTFKAQFDIKSLALASYDGTVTMDNVPVTAEIVNMALESTVSEYDKMNKAIEKLRQSDEARAAIAYYETFRHLMLAAIEKYASGAEFVSVFDIRNPHTARKAKGNSTSSVSSAASESATRTYTKQNLGKVIKGALSIKKTLKDKGTIVLTTGKNGEWSITATNQDGVEKVYNYATSDMGLSKATTHAYQFVSGTEAQKSVYAYWGEESFVDA